MVYIYFIHHKLLYIDTSTIAYEGTNTFTSIALASEHCDSGIHN